jgi:predicted  nucleic acid-binding Zn-ribbon protein
MTDSPTIGIVIAHLERIEAKVDKSTLRSDERHEETKREIMLLSAEIRLLRANDELHQGAVRGVEERMAQIEGRMHKIETEHNRVKRATDEGDAIQQAALMSAMTIVQRQQEQLREDFVEAQSATAKAIGSLVTSLSSVRLPRWARITLAVSFALGTFAAGILAGLVSHGVIKF